MNKKRRPGFDTEIDDFAELLLPQNGENLPAIIGGHAVGLWSRYYLSKGVTGLAKFLPFRSKDLDLVGTMELLDRLQRRFKGIVLRSEPTTLPKIVAPHHQASRWRLSRELRVLRGHVTWAV